ncbi:DUF7289 family protein [Natrinema salsiterrestre]|uniref:DUF7305 domain-containing protein n=1 Tax=Natrinema salsiterrestre TaxID=2950540 RepID=A0A9Q4KYY3_9EURY|nr:hypothetical protein [Natrinema salsiterrestre]MDF9744277.1 hypothetical protein [Natrinema salsiterrestre]
MISGRGSESFLLSERGQSALIGVILLIGMAATVSVGVLLVAGDVMNGAEQQSQNQRVEQGFVELGHEMSTVSVSDDSSRTVSFEAGDSGAVTKTKAGWIHIEGGDVDINRSIGAVEYVGDDGTVVAYQSGGVWRETGNKTRMLSAPNIDYDSEDETLWFPITTLSGSQSLDSGDVSIEHNSTDPIGNVTFVENDTVTVTIQSDYYRGWERYFRTEAGGASVQNVYHENRTVDVLLGYDDLDGAFEQGATIGSDEDKHFEDKHDKIGEDYAMGTPLPEMDPVIDEMVTDAKAGDVDKNLSNSTYSNPLDDGTYFIEEIDGNEEYNFDLSDGNATLIVEEDVDLEGSINVVDHSDDHVLRIYAGGNRFDLDGTVCVDTGSGCEQRAEIIQFYGPSTMGVDLGPSSGGTFEGVLYVASSEEKSDDWWEGTSGGGSCKEEYQVRMQASGTDFNGSMVAYSVCTQSNSMQFDYDEDLAGAEIDPYPEDYTLPPQITYLNIAVHELDVENK